MDKNTTLMEIRELIQYAARQFLFAMDSPIVAGILCGIFAGVIYKIISVYVRKSIDVGETSHEREDNVKENGSAFAEKNEVSKKRTSNPPENTFVKDTSDNGMEPEVTSTDKEETDGKARDPCEDVRRRNSRHPSEKDKPFFELLQIMDLLQGNVTPEILDNEQPPIEISEWFACQNQNEGSTYDLKVTLQDEDRAAIVDFYYGYDFSKSPKGICKKVSHTFKKYGPGIRSIMFRHRIGKDVEINNGEYCCKLSGGIIQVSRNKVNTFLYLRIIYFYL